MIQAHRVIAYVGLGSNLDDPVGQVTTALLELGRLHSTRCVRHSSLYRTRPLGPQDQPDYINAVAQLETGLAPEPLLDALQGLELRHRRVRQGPRWGPRTLDLDLLLYDQQRVASERLVVPHPEMTRRAFVLLPLAEVAPEGLEIPGYASLVQCLTRIAHDGVQRLA
jgi:2-amino-4-hydroxy-6-hydroxymethyldihydropteridine diphosphokinase